MKLLFLSILATIVVAGGMLWTQGKDMREIRSEIEIDAPPEKVWQVVTNIEKWSSWMPVVNASSGKIALGSKLDLTMVGENGGDGPQYQPVIQELSEPVRFRWRAKMMAGFIFTNDKIIELEQTSAGTRLIHIEGFQGLMTSLMWSKMESGVPPILKSMNQALKDAAEGGLRY